MTDSYSGEEDIQDDSDSGEGFEYYANPESKLQQTHPELYGRLLLANKKINDTGSGTLFLLLFTFSVVTCSTLHEINWKEKIGIQSGWWASFFLYSIITIFFFVFLMRIDDAREAKAYIQLKQKLITAIDSTRIDRYEFMSMILKDDYLSDIANHLSNDDDFVD